MTRLWVLVLLLIPNLASATGVLTPAANPPQTMTILSQTAIPFIKAPSGSIGNNCAISGLTALPKTYSGGAYLYLPASAIAAGSSAGWYWFVASSTTAGTCYNSTYTSGQPVAGVTTAFATTGPGAFTGATGALTGWTVTLPANSLGANGRLDGTFSWLQNNNANSKTTQLNFGAATWWNRSDTTTTGLVGQVSVLNRGKTNVQAISGLFSTAAASASSLQQATDGAIDTTANVTVSVTINAATATDYVIHDSHRMVITRQD